MTSPDDKFSAVDELLDILDLEVLNATCFVVAAPRRDGNGCLAAR